MKKVFLLSAFLLSAGAAAFAQTVSADDRQRGEPPVSNVTEDRQRGEPPVYDLSDDRQRGEPPVFDFDLAD